MRLYGLIGYPLSHSFSGTYFAAKFDREGITDARYNLYPIETIEALPGLIAENPSLKGLNVTIPYKQDVKKYLDSLDSSAEKVGAVNVVKIHNGILKGFNSDYFGFRNSLVNWTGTAINSVKALILGTGGAAKAVVAVLQDLNIPFRMVSRSRNKGGYIYEDIDQKVISEYRLIINTTPLGMAPATEQFPDLPYRLLTENHFLYDLIYNPEETKFLEFGRQQGAKTKNGLEMLHLQAEKSWEIWNEPQF